MEMYGAIVEPPMFIIVMGKVDCTLGGHETTYIHIDFGLLSRIHEFSLHVTLP